jgi:hypothetical protein
VTISIAERDSRTALASLREDTDKGTPMTTEELPVAAP